MDRSMAPENAAIPKFGEWNNPKSADQGYTQIFDQKRIERQVREGKVQPNETPSFKTESKQDAHVDKVKKRCCIPCLGI